jgi:hypothetical protein
MLDQWMPWAYREMTFRCSPRAAALYAPQYNSDVCRDSVPVPDGSYVADGVVAYSKGN